MCKLSISHDTIFAITLNWKIFSKTDNLTKFKTDKYYKKYDYKMKECKFTMPNSSKKFYGAVHPDR